MTEKENSKKKHGILRNRNCCLVRRSNTMSRSEPSIEEHDRFYLVQRPRGISEWIGRGKGGIRSVDTWRGGWGGGYMRRRPLSRAQESCSFQGSWIWSRRDWVWMKIALLNLVLRGILNRCAGHNSLEAAGFLNPGDCLCHQKFKSAANCLTSSDQWLLQEWTAYQLI